MPGQLGVTDLKHVRVEVVPAHDRLDGVMRIVETEIGGHAQHSPDARRDMAELEPKIENARHRLSLARGMSEEPGQRRARRCSPPCMRTTSRTCRGKYGSPLDGHQRQPRIWVTREARMWILTRFAMAAPIQVVLDVLVEQAEQMAKLVRHAAGVHVAAPGANARRA